MFTHWLHVVAIKDYELLPKRPVPAWVLPDPPRFTKCIAHLADHSSAAPPSTGSSPLAQCRQHYDQLRRQTLTFLITGKSLIAEGEARHLGATAAEMRARFTNKVLKNEFSGSRAAFSRYSRLTGETVADELFRTHIKVTTEKLEHHFETAPGLSDQQRQRAFVEWSENFPRRWAKRTTCRKGYVVPNCKEYRGPLAPEIVI